MIVAFAVQHRRPHRGDCLTGGCCSACAGRRTGSPTGSRPRRRRWAATRAAPAAPASAAAPAAAVVSEPVRMAQDFALPALDGRIVSLRDLLAAGKPTLLHFTDPKCGPCYELLADIGGWARVYGDRLTVATISGGDLNQNRLLAREYGLGTVLLQHEHEVADLLGLPMIPGAILIAPDGRMTDSTTGAHRVRELVAAALGLVVPPQEAKPVETVRVGQKVGELRRPDLDGNTIDLGARRASRRCCSSGARAAATAASCSRRCARGTPIRTGRGWWWSLRSGRAEPGGGPPRPDDPRRRGGAEAAVWRAGDAGGGADRRERAGGRRGGAGGDDGAGPGRPALRRRHRGRLIHPPDRYRPSVRRRRHFHVNPALRHHRQALRPAEGRGQMPYAQEPRRRPPPTSDGEKIPYLFVQSFEGGSIAPKDGEDGTYTLTLEHGLGQTLYFADRPPRCRRRADRALPRGAGLPRRQPAQCRARGRRRQRRHRHRRRRTAQPVYRPDRAGRDLRRDGAGGLGGHDGAGPPGGDRRTCPICRPASGPPTSSSTTAPTTPLNAGTAGISSASSPLRPFATTTDLPALRAVRPHAARWCSTRRLLDEQVQSALSAGCSGQCHRRLLRQRYDLPLGGLTSDRSASRFQRIGGNDMANTRFDSISKLFARRRTVAGGTVSQARRRPLPPGRARRSRTSSSSPSRAAPSPPRRARTGPLP